MTEDESSVVETPEEWKRREKIEQFRFDLRCAIKDDTDKYQELHLFKQFLDRCYASGINYVLKPYTIKCSKYVEECEMWLRAPIALPSLRILKNIILDSGARLEIDDIRFWPNGWQIIFRRV